MGPDGRELTRLAGFSSAAKLTAGCREVLNRLEGKAAPEEGPRPAAAARDVEVTTDTVDAAVRKGRAWLQDAKRRGWGTSAPGMGPEELVLYAWASSGLTGADEEVATLQKAATAAPPAGTYQAALRALALGRLDPKRHRVPLEACARYLVEAQLRNGQWTYTRTEAPASPPMGDNSNSAYALLGLAACRKAGVDVPAEVVRKAEAWWRKSQNADGGWGYRADRETESYASMTESGIGSLIVCDVLLGRAPGADPTRDRAVAWLAARFSVSENAGSAYQEGRLLYHLYALERLGSLSVSPKVGERDWYREGASFLLATQRPDGDWDDGADTSVPNTCFALLFLTHATSFLR